MPLLSRIVRASNVNPRRVPTPKADRTCFFRSVSRRILLSFRRQRAVLTTGVKTCGDPVEQGQAEHDENQAMMASQTWTKVRLACPATLGGMREPK